MLIENNRLAYNGNLLPLVRDPVDYSVPVYSDHGTRKDSTINAKVLDVRFAAATVESGDRLFTYVYSNCSCYYSVVGNKWSDGGLMQPKLTKDRELGLLTVSSELDAAKAVREFSDRLIRITGSESLQGK